jgi:long-chain acyl-CoA synthetase
VLNERLLQAPVHTCFDEEGFKTGDIGQYDHDGFDDYWTSKKRQFKQIKASTSPAPLELKLAINKDIDQICLVGTGIPQPIALITLSELGKPNPKHHYVLD